MGEEVLEALAVVRGEFARRLGAIGEADWPRATPCSEWDVRRLANHVVGQEHRFARSVGGGSVEAYVASRDDDFLGDDPIGSWHLGVRALDRAIGGLADLDVKVAWRVPMSARDFLGVRVFEAAVHTWDLSRALGYDETLDAGVADVARRAVEKLLLTPDLAAFFAPPRTASPPDASPQARLLHLAGREP